MKANEKSDNIDEIVRGKNSPRIELKYEWAKMSTSSDSIYSQLGLLMMELINNPKNINFIRNISRRVYSSMALSITQCAELGYNVQWIADRVIYIHHIMLSAEACLQRKVSYETYLRDSRLHMDLCSRAGVSPSKPPGC